MKIKKSIQQQIKYNIIEKPTKHLFVHIPKTAGVTILQLLNGAKPPYTSHFSISKYKQYLGEEINNYFTFAFIRNPWDRMVSLYLYRKSRLDEFPQFDIQFPTFEIYINKIYKMYLDNKKNVHTKSQFSFISENNKIIVDYIGKFETLQKDINIIFSQVNRSIPKKLPHQHKMNRTHYSEYYNKQTEKIIAEMFNDDIKYFGYTYN